jgi:hypothetical protein
MQLQAPSENTMVDVAVDRLGERFPSVAKDQLDATVRRVLGDVLHGARVTTFAGIIAERRARSELEAALSA